ncbi:MAG: MmgE/PrpD family protein [Bryobacteraceae bacterium]
MGAGYLGVPPARSQSASKARFPKSEGLTRYVAEFVVKTQYADVPADVIELGRKSILDGLGLALAGSVAETGDLSRTYIRSLGPISGSATVLGSSMKTSPRFAAFLNGVSVHADDYDDTQLASAKDRVYGLLTHPTVASLCPALAVAEQEVKSGRDLALAYQVGVEVECKIAETIAPRHYEDGFHSTGTIGVFGSAAALAKLRDFDVERTRRAFGIAASQSGGLRANFGTMSKPFQAGHAAEAGVVATDLAALGWTASEQILEAPSGFFHAAGGGFDAATIAGKLGNPWTFRDPGVSIKPFPSGSLTHPGMTELLRLIHEHQIRPQDVERIDVGTNSYMPTALIYHRPTNSLQAKFSMEFCMAALLLYGKAGLTTFTNEVVNRPEVQSMIGRVHFSVQPEAEAAGYNKMTTIIDIRLKDGQKIHGKADFGKGSPADPMSYEDVAAKFLDCAGYARWPEAKAKAVVEHVRRLEHLADVRILTALCRQN